MNVYDFDGTLYTGDSTFDFIRFLMARHPELLGRIPSIAAEFARFKFLKWQDKTDFKEKMFGMFALVPDMEEEVRLFWRKNRNKLKKYYRQTAMEGDLVISASPEFLIVPACRILGIERVIGSRVDMKTGRYTGINCRGSEKIRRLRVLTDEKIEDFYSDSHADDPLAALAERAWMVRGESITPWKTK